MIPNLQLIIAISLLILALKCEGFSTNYELKNGPKLKSTTQMPLSANDMNNDDDDDDIDKEELLKQQKVKQQSTLDVIQQCMGVSPEPDGFITRPTAVGLSGFAVDSELGFVAILTNAKQQCTYVVISPTDKAGEVRSPEALCMVQLAGGLDLGTPILPPDCFARLVADELDKPEMSSDKIRLHLDLLEVHAKPALASQEQEMSDDQNNDKDEVVSPSVSTPERTTKLVCDLPKFMNSIKNLPGVQGSTDDQVLDAMKLHADAEGKIDRDGFTAILDNLRRANSAKATNNKVRFELLVSLNNDDNYTEPFVVPVASPLQAIGLALRYKKDINISEDCEIEIDAMDLISRFPNFKPIQELQEDAKMVDDFIPSMFAKATAPNADERA